MEQKSKEEVVQAGNRMIENIVFRKDIDRSVIFDLIQLAKLFNVNGLTRSGIYRYFEDLRDYWITEDMATIWQLSAQKAKINCDENVIGWDDMADQQFFIELADGLITANPKYKYMLLYLKPPIPRNSLPPNQQTTKLC